MTDEQKNSHITTERERVAVSVSEKYMLTIKEAAEYFSIGTKKMRRLSSVVHINSESAGYQRIKSKIFLQNTPPDCGPNLRIVRGQRRQIFYAGGCIKPPGNLRMMRRWLR